MSNDNKIKIVAVIGVFLLLLSLIPLLILSGYSHPHADDYDIIMNTSRVWNETGSLLKMIQEAIQTNLYYYYNWQGTMSVIFFGQFQPWIFGYPYGIVAYILIFSYLFSTFYFIRTWLKDGFGATRAEYLLTASALSLFTLQYLPFPSEGIYWWGGGITYTFVYSVGLIQLALLTKYVLSGTRSSRFAYLFFALFLALVLGFGNLTLPLFFILLQLIILAGLILRKNKGIKGILAVVIATTISYFLTIAAPGNSVRAGYVETTPLPTAIIKAFYYGYADALHYLSPSLILLLLLLTPILYRIASRSQMGFRMPLAFLTASALLYCSIFAPVIYGYSGYFPERFENISFILLVTLLIANLFYFAGWYKGKSVVVFSRTRSAIAGFTTKYLGLFFLIIFGLAVLIPGIHNFEQLASFSAMRSILNGEAREYDRQMSEREQLLQSEEESDVILDPITTIPSLFPPDIIRVQPHIWPNNTLEQYFGKDSIRLRTE